MVVALPSCSLEGNQGVSSAFFTQAPEWAIRGLRWKQRPGAVCFLPKAQDKVHILERAVRAWLGPRLNPLLQLQLWVLEEEKWVVGVGVVNTRWGCSPHVCRGLWEGAGSSFLSPDLSLWTLSLLSCSYTFLPVRVPHKFPAGGSSWGVWPPCPGGLWPSPRPASTLSSDLLETSGGSTNPRCVKRAVVHTAHTLNVPFWAQTWKCAFIDPLPPLFSPSKAFLLSMRLEFCIASVTYTTHKWFAYDFWFWFL